MEQQQPIKCERCGLARHEFPCVVHRSIMLGILNVEQARAIAAPEASGELDARQDQAMRQALTRAAKRAAPPGLDPLLQQAIADGHLTEAQARDVDALCDGIVGRVRAGELTRAQGSALVTRTAISDGLAALAARDRREALEWGTNVEPEYVCARILARLLGREPAAPAPPVGRMFTVPWEPQSDGEIPGRTVYAVRLAAQMAIAGGWSRATLQARPRWNEQSIAGSLVRVAVRWGLIP